MRILSHRGLWLEAGEKNAPIAFERSFAEGFGTETDVRDRLGELVISHDPPDASAMLFDDLLNGLADRRLPLAINIKADGIGPAVKAAMDRRGLVDWFAFDMSVPETVVYARLGIPFFTRMSEFEPDPPLLDRAKGVWIDAFEEEWRTIDQIAPLIDRGLTLCLVSPELHKRAFDGFWSMIRGSRLARSERLWLCTDHPREASQYFRGSP
jgi:hypothetical protein